MDTVLIVFVEFNIFLDLLLTITRIVATWIT